MTYSKNVKSLIFSRLSADHELNASSCRFGDESNEISNPFPQKTKLFIKVVYLIAPPGGGGTLGLFGWGGAAGTLEPIAYTRASSSEFCYPILD